jgi:hypothetical protein
MKNRTEKLIAGSASAGTTPGRPAARSSLHGPAARAVPPHEPESRGATVRDELESALNGAVLSRRDPAVPGQAAQVGQAERAVRDLPALAGPAGRPGRGGAHHAPAGSRARRAQRRRDLPGIGRRFHGLLGLRGLPRGRCPEHAGDFDRARACHELALALASGGISPSPIPQPSTVAG